MAARVIRFSFDYISSNAYLAWCELPALASRYGYAIEPIPVLFAGLLEAHGQLGPAEMPAKSLWMLKNTLRKASKLGHPLNPPAYHPFNPLLALRASALPALSPEQRHALVTALFEAVWVSGLHVSEPSVVEALASRIGLDGPAIVQAASEDAAKTRLRRDTEAAIARGVFGVPSMEVGDDLFWGYDDFPYLEPVLAGRDLLRPEAWAAWMRPTTASAMRRRFR